MALKAPVLDRAAVARVGNVVQVVCVLINVHGGREERSLLALVDGARHGREEGAVKPRKGAHLRGGKGR